MARRLGVGIVGLGGIGATHAVALSELRDEVELCCFSGGSGQHASDAGWPEAQEVTPAAVATHPRVEVVVVCSPSGSHAQHALAALAAGCHVVVEKPLATSSEDAERIAASARKTGRWVTMVAQRRFEPLHQTVKGLLDGGVLGDLRLGITQVHWSRGEDYYAGSPWRRSMAAGGGSLMNQGVHNLDLLRWLCGPVETVTAQFATLGHSIEAEDTTVATLRFASGALGLVSTSTATPPGAPASITLQLEKGVVELGQGELLRWDVDGVEPPTSARTSVVTGATDPRAIGHLGHVAQWRHVLGRWRDGRPPAVGADDAAATVRVLCAIYAAAETGRAVDVREGG